MFLPASIQPIVGKLLFIGSLGGRIMDKINEVEDKKDIDFEFEMERETHFTIDKRDLKKSAVRWLPSAGWARGSEQGRIWSGVIPTRTARTYCG